MNKKFVKPYCGIPDSQNRIDVDFERGYRKRIVRFNSKDAAPFTSAEVVLTAGKMFLPNKNPILNS